MAYRKAAPNGTSSTATREIAALDFLLNIPLSKEEEIVRSGLEAEQIKIGEGRGILLDRSHSIDDEEKMEIGLDAEGLGGVMNENSDSLGWWQPMIRKNKEFFSAEEERMKAREQLELETGELERPDGNDALSAMEEGTLSAMNQGRTASHLSLSHLSSLHHKNNVDVTFAPGRRLHGADATVVRIPREEAQTERNTTMRTVVRKALVREWEQQMVSSVPNAGGNNESGKQSTSILDGRVFFSGMSSYPMAVFSVIKYEPKKEEEIIRRRKLEALGGGGSQFVMPSRDWRGISYRYLLPRTEKKNKSFNRIINQGKKEAFDKRRRRLLRKKRAKRRERRRNRKLKEKKVENLNIGVSKESNTASGGDISIDSMPSFDSEDGGDVSSDSVLLFDSDASNESYNIHASKNDEDSLSSSSSEDSTSYYPGFLDDPQMVQGRHRHVMVGDKVTGCVVSSTIHFVKPSDLKADLNKQFREKFDQWEPPKAQRKYIGARVIEGCYTLVDPTDSIAKQEENDHLTSDDEGAVSRRNRKPSISTEIENIRMPISLTLSKIRNIKKQALLACINANLEVSTVALACVYFERLCLDCRVDKSNRRLTFAACLLIAIKINEANVALEHEQPSKITKKGVGVLKSWIRSKKDGDVFASLLEFFTHEWSLSLKTLFAAEFGVFAALGFKLQATPSQVAFHFKKIMKALEWNPMNYLGEEMYDMWQECLSEEAIRENQKDRRHKERQRRKEEKFLKLQRELQIMEAKNNSHRRKMSASIYDSIDDSESRVINTSTFEVGIEEANIGNTPPKGQKTKKAGLNIFNRIGLKRSTQNLNTLISPRRIYKNSEIEEVTDNRFLPPRSMSSPNLVGEHNSFEKEDEIKG